jgi:hypothetical protein
MRYLIPDTAVADGQYDDNDLIVTTLIHDSVPRLLLLENRSVLRLTNRLPKTKESFHLCCGMVVRQNHPRNKNFGAKCT